VRGILEVLRSDAITARKHLHAASSPLAPSVDPRTYRWR